MLDEEAAEPVGLRPKRLLRARGDGEFRLGVSLRGELVADLSLAERVSADLSAEALGVRGVSWADDGREVGAEAAADVLFAVLSSFVGRVGELLFAGGLGGLPLLPVGVDGVVGGVALTAFEFFSAAR